MRLLVTGATGEVGRCLAEVAAGDPGIELVAAPRAELDLADPAGMRTALARIRPEIVISAAAFTDVAAAERDAALAYRINADGAGALAAAAAEIGAGIVHLSTDYVFSGDKPGAYDEADPPAPLNVYGASKLTGERLVAAANPRHAVVRTAWLFSPYGRRFLHAILDAAEGTDEIAVVADQEGNPTSGLSLAAGLLTLARAMAEGNAVAPLYHLAGEGEATRSEMAREILRRSAALGGPSARVREVATPASEGGLRRPLNSRLDSSLFRARFRFRMPDWRAELGMTVERVLQADRAAA